MNHSRHRRPAARPNVRGRTRNGAGRWQSSDERRCDVGDTLRNELDVGVVPIPDHAIGDRCGHERLDGPEHRDGQNRRQQRPNHLGVELGNVQRWKAGRNTPESRAYGFDGQCQDVNEHGTADESNDGSGHGSKEPLKRADQQQRPDAKHGCCRRQRPDALRHLHHPRDELSGWPENL